MDIYHRNPHPLTDAADLVITPELGIASLCSADLPESNEPKTSTVELISRICSDCMAHEQDNADLETVESAEAVAVEGVINQHFYLDIIDAAYLLRRPPCYIRHLAETGVIPAHALRHEGEICWKFRPGELLDWAADIGIEVSPKALSDLLSLVEPQ